MRERIPNRTEAQKVRNPIPGFWRVPIPRRSDSMDMRIERSSQKRLLLRSREFMVSPTLSAA
jgi:hypothetical protein